MCLNSVSGYRLLYPPPSLRNSLLDITLGWISFRCRFGLFG